MKTSLIAFLCLLSSVALKINHLQTTSYLSTLKNQQQSILPQIAVIKNQIASLQGTLNIQQDIGKKIKLLQDVIIKHKKLVNFLAFSLNTPLNESSWSCQILSPSSKSEINTFTNNILNSSTLLNSYIGNIPNLTISAYFSEESNAIKTVADQIQKDAFSSGKQVNSIESGSYTNWLNNNWAVENASLLEVEQQMKSINQANSYYVICPEQIPFFNGKDCISCESGKYFLLTSKSCVTCDSFDSIKHICKNNTSPIPQNNTINGSNLLSGGNRIILPADTSIQAIQTTPVQSCPVDKPFFTSDRQCINCQIPNALFDWSLKKCTTCPDGTTFSIQKHSCIGQQKKYVTNIPVASTRLILPDGVTLESLQIQQQRMALNNQIISCPSDRPFYNNNVCLNCDNNQYFAIGSLSCQSCPAGTQFNATSLKCNSIFYYSNLIIRNWTSTNPTIVQQRTINSSKLIGSTVCPIESPFYNSFSCINCPINQYFNFDGLKCQVCPQGTIFSLNQHSCVKSESGLFQTDPRTAPNLIYDGISKGEWSTIYLQNQQKNPMIKDCPIDRPYFDGLRCIGCTSKAPYFNLKHKICQFCDQDASYDGTVHECLSNSGQIIDQKPTIEKMIASIFT